MRDLGKLISGILGGGILALALIGGIGCTLALSSGMGFGGALLAACGAVMVAVYALVGGGGRK